MHSFSDCQDEEFSRAARSSQARCNFNVEIGEKSKEYEDESIEAESMK
jgi:hypothetical protein